ncbi:MAG: hypothetical protein K2I42_06095, partial [Anaeroplasmataceae bacterium]|nr:hypothetical protein [Anaeroplasmataceae bacterium]
LGILVIFRVLIKILFPSNFALSPYFEILGGLNTITQPWIAASALGFLGISIHFQILYIHKEISYFKFLSSRIFFLLVGIVVFL